MRKTGNGRKEAETDAVYGTGNGENVRKICEDETRTVFQVKGDSGEGLMTLYQVFRGCYLIYNDFYMKECCSGFKPSAQIFCIDHCKEGRIEWCVNRKRYIFGWKMQVQ